MGESYAQKQQKMMQHMLEVGFEAGCQKFADLYSAALISEGYGPERLYRIALKVSQIEREFGDAWGCEKESDFLQDKLDRILEKGYGERFRPFAERNEHIKKFNYKGKMKK